MIDAHLIQLVRWSEESTQRLWRGSCAACVDAAVSSCFLGQLCMKCDSDTGFGVAEGGERRRPGRCTCWHECWRKVAAQPDPQRVSSSVGKECTRERRCTCGPRCACARCAERTYLLPIASRRRWRAQSVPWRDREAAGVCAGAASDLHNEHLHTRGARAASELHRQRPDRLECVLSATGGTSSGVCTSFTAPRREPPSNGRKASMHVSHALGHITSP